MLANFISTNIRQETDWVRFSNGNTKNKKIKRKLSAKWKEKKRRLEPGIYVCVCSYVCKHEKQIQLKTNARDHFPNNGLQIIFKRSLTLSFSLHLFICVYVSCACAHSLKNDMLKVRNRKFSNHMRSIVELYCVTEKAGGGHCGMWQIQNYCHDFHVIVIVMTECMLNMSIQLLCALISGFVFFFLFVLSTERA